MERLSCPQMSDFQKCMVLPKPLRRLSQALGWKRGNREEEFPWIPGCGACSCEGHRWTEDTGHLEFSGRSQGMETQKPGQAAQP